MIEYDPITVSYAWELTSVSMCYSQRDGFNTSLFGLLYLDCTDGQSFGIIRCSVLHMVCLPCVVVFGGTVMCYPGRR